MDPMATLFLVFLWNPHTVLHSGCTLGPFLIPLLSSLMSNDLGNMELCLQKISDYDLFSHHHCSHLSQAAVITCAWNIAITLLTSQGPSILVFLLAIPAARVNFQMQARLHRTSAKADVLTRPSTLHPMTSLPTACLARSLWLITSPLSSSNIPAAPGGGLWAVGLTVWQILPHS